MPDVVDAVAQPPEQPTPRTPAQLLFDRITAEIGKIFVGQEELVLGTLVALFSSGHVLIESVPGLGKTLFVRTLGRVLGCKFGRIQFTADLMPSDITGSPIFDMKTQEFRFRPGPVFTQLLLADEINRSPAKTHAALLEIMQEYRVTVERTSHKIERPFLVLATQNPIESEGTYNLPEAQLDRFMFKLVLDYPSADEEADILAMHSAQSTWTSGSSELAARSPRPRKSSPAAEQFGDVRIDPKLIDYINQIVRLTRQWPQFHMGASPRAGIALMQGARTLAAFRGRDYAVPDDVVELALPALRHRVILSAEAEVEGQKVDELLRTLTALGGGAPAVSPLALAIAETGGRLCAVVRCWRGRVASIPRKRLVLAVLDARPSAVAGTLGRATALLPLVVLVDVALVAGSGGRSGDAARGEDVLRRARGGPDRLAAQAASRSRSTVDNHARRGGSTSRSATACRERLERRARRSSTSAWPAAAARCCDYDLRAERRGLVRAGGGLPPRPEPAGVLAADARLSRSTTVLHVYPDMKQLGQYAVLARTNRLNLLGVRRTRRIGQDHDFERLRDYTLDDNYKHIDWRAPPGAGNSPSRTSRPARASGSSSWSIAAG